MLVVLRVAREWSRCCMFTYDVASRLIDSLHHSGETTLNNVAKKRIFVRDRVVSLWRNLGLHAVFQCNAQRKQGYHTQVTQSFDSWC